MTINATEGKTKRYITGKVVSRAALVMNETSDSKLSGAKTNKTMNNPKPEKERERKVMDSF